MKIPTITLANKKLKDKVIINRDDKEMIEAYRKRGYTEEIYVGDNEKTPAADTSEKE